MTTSFQKFDQLVAPIQQELETRWGTSGWSTPELKVIQTQARRRLWEVYVQLSQLDHSAHAPEHPWNLLRLNHYLDDPATPRYLAEQYEELEWQTRLRYRELIYKIQKV